MADKIQLSIVTPEREVVSIEVDEITAPGWEGEFGVLPNHAPFLALLKHGELDYRIGDDVHSVAVGFGFAEVLPDKVTVLIETAEKAEEIDIDRATAARDKALKTLEGQTGRDIDFEKARASLMRAISRLEIAKKYGRSIKRNEQRFQG
jgi:F-type H+-transporting ATPase subunit epsilon